MSLKEGFIRLRLRSSRSINASLALALSPPIYLLAANTLSICSSVIPPAILRLLRPDDF